MSKEASPAFQWYPSDYLSDIHTQLMTIEEEGCYRRLLDFCWLEIILPGDIDLLTGLCKGTVPSDRVLSCFTVSDGGYRHTRLDRERDKQAAWRAKCAKGGKHSAGKRKHTQEKTIEQGTSTTPPRLVELEQQGSSTLQSSVSSLQSSIPITEKHIKSKPSKRCPKDFVVSSDLRTWASKTVPEVDIDFETGAFMDYEYKNGHVDWDATWREWMRTAAKKNGNGLFGKPHKETQSEQTDRVIRELEQKGTL